MSDLELSAMAHSPTTDQPTQIAYSTCARSLPVRLEGLACPPFFTYPLFKSITEARRSGRSYQVNRLWGMVEARMIAELNQMWAELFADPAADLESLLDRHLPPLAERLKAILSSATAKYTV